MAWLYFVFVQSVFVSVEQTLAVGSSISLAEESGGDASHSSFRSLGLSAQGLAVGLCRLNQVNP
jgi:hypothetical protein